MSEEALDLNEIGFKKGAMNMRALAVLEPAVRSVIDPATNDFLDTPQVSAIRNNHAFDGLYIKARNELNELGTPTIPVTPARVITHMLTHKMDDLRSAITFNDALKQAVLHQAEAGLEGTVPPSATPRASMRREIKPKPVADAPAAFTFLAPQPTAKEIRLAEAAAIAPRVLFDQEGNLKPGGVLTQPAFADDYEKFKRTLNDNVGTLRPVAEEVTANKFLESVFADESHPHHHSLREAILRAAKKLPPEKPARTANSLSDQVRASIEAAQAPQSTSR